MPGYQNFFATTLFTDIGATDTVITLTTVPAVAPGRLVLEARNPTQREIITYTAIAGNQVTGVVRGVGGTTAKPHTKNSLVEMNLTAEDIADLYAAFGAFAATNGSGWYPSVSLPTSIVANGNRNYLFTMPGDMTNIFSNSMKIRGTRTLAAPTQGALITATSWLSKSSPNKSAWNDNFTLLATVKLSAYGSGGNKYIHGRGDATSANAWGIYIDGNGRVGMFGANGGSSNFRMAYTHTKLNLNREYKLAASWASGVITIYVDGQQVLVQANTSGTAPTTVGQTGDYAIGRIGQNSSTQIQDIEISQTAVFNAVLTATQIRNINSAGIVGNETNLQFAHSLNGVLTDLNTTTPNDLTNNGSVAFQTGGGFNNYGASTTLEYGQIVTNPVFSAGSTTFQVQVPSGCAFPVAGTPLSALHYSTSFAPAGFPRDAVQRTAVISSVRASSNIAPGDGSFNLDSYGLAISVYAPYTMSVQVHVELSCISSTDYEFKPSIRVDGTNTVIFDSSAAPSSGTRSVERSLTADITLTPGYHTISAGVDLFSGTGYLLQAGGQRLTVIVPVPILG